MSVTEVLHYAKLFLRALIFDIVIYCAKRVKWVYITKSNSKTEQEKRSEKFVREFSSKIRFRSGINSLL